jgi:hypothetical protein
MCCGKAARADVVPGADLINPLMSHLLGQMSDVLRQSRSR